MESVPLKANRHFRFQKCLPTEISQSSGRVANQVEYVKHEQKRIYSKAIHRKKYNPDADVSALETEIDRLVYQLYGLTDEEIALVEGLDGTGAPRTL